MSDRETSIDGFLDQAGWSGARRSPLAGDASARRYWRIEDGKRRAVLMDAPPDKVPLAPFLAIDGKLRGLGYSAPTIMAADEATGLALLEDFGDASIAARLEAGDDPAKLYSLAIDFLIDLHRKGEVVTESLPPYDDGRLLEEVGRFVLWYAPAVLGAPASDAALRAFGTLWRRLIPFARAAPASLVYRDFHAENLMILDRPGVASLGLLDFQDAVAGPITYDLASLLEDARRDVAPELADEMRARYRAAFPKLDRNMFDASWAVMAVHRHLKCLGLFVRLAKRDGKPAYLVHIPRLWRLVEESLRHPVLAPLAGWLDSQLPPARRIVPRL